MRTLLGVVAVLAGLACTSCLRTTYNRCTEMPPDRECESLDAGREAGPDADTDASADVGAADAGTSDVGAADAGTSDAGTDGG